MLNCKIYVGVNTSVSGQFEVFLFVAIIVACLNVFELQLNIEFDNRRKNHWCENNFQLYIFISATTHLIGFNQFKLFRRIIAFKGAYLF